MVYRIAPIAALLVALAAAGGWWAWRSAISAPASGRAETVGRASVASAPGMPPSLVGRLATLAPATAFVDLGWFTEMTAASGIDFRHHSGTNAEKPFPAANGSGVAALDYDLDGRCDLYFATGTPFPIDPTRRAPINRCFRNRGHWRFDDVTLACGLGHNGYSAGLAVGDYDADGFPDVFVACFGANCLYHNQGDGSFQRVEQMARVADERWATSAAFLDFDDDGLLDLYVCNYAEWTWESRRFCGDRVRNVRIYCSPSTVEPAADILYRNRGDGTFGDATAESGVDVRSGRAQGVVAADVNDDGLIDLYVGNDLNPNSLFLNRGGRFEDASEASGAAYDRLGRSQAGMGVEAADVNGDGRLDLFVTNFESENNTLYENLGGELFQDTTQRYALADESLPWIGWGTAFADFDLDGWLDLVVTNGHVDDNRHLLGQQSPYAEPPLAYRNVHGRFEFLGATAGPYFAASHVGRGLATADLDGDGDQDLVIVHQDDRPALLHNNRLSSDASSHPCVVVQLIGTRANRDAVGAKVTLSAGGQTATQFIKGGGSYLSTHERRLAFATGLGAEAPTLEIRWPGGALSTVSVESGRRYVIIEPTPPATPSVSSQGISYE
jgi:hypothetical protein